MCEASTHTVAVPFRILTGFLYSPLSLNASQRHLNVYLVVNRIPRIYYFVNRETFQQSTYCFVKLNLVIEKIEGRVSVRIWPLNKIGKIDK